MAPRTTKAKRTTKSESTISVDLNGITFVLDIEECTAIDAADVRRRLGLSLRGLFERAATDPDIDVIATLVWLARRHDGEDQLTWDEVAATIDYSADISTDVPDDVKAGAEGEA